MKRTSPTILILGAQGMLGHTVYHLLKSHYPAAVFGTSHRKEKTLLYLSVDTAKKDMKVIEEKIGQIDYVINCIGKLQNCENTKELIQVNAMFPHFLSELAETYQFSVFHISTDAVFSNIAKGVTESSSVSPSTAYGASKFLGEVISPNVLTIRTSIIGLDPLSHKGLLEWTILCIRNPQAFELRGFTNHLWSGGTTLQLAQFLETIITKDLFPTITKKTSLLHFAPLGPVTKYEILKAFLAMFTNKTEIKKMKETYSISRYLRTSYPELIPQIFTNDVQEAIAQLLSFEKQHGYHIIA